RSLGLSEAETNGHNDDQNTTKGANHDSQAHQRGVGRLESAGAWRVGAAVRRGSSWSAFEMGVTGRTSLKRQRRGHRLGRTLPGSRPRLNREEVLCGQACEVRA